MKSVFRQEYKFHKDCAQYKEKHFSELYSREDITKMTEMICNIRAKYKFMVLEMKFTEPMPDDVVGGVRVTISDGKNTLTVEAIHLTDAMYMAEKKMEALQAEQAIVAVPVEQAPISIAELEVPKPKISAASLRI